MHSLEAWKMLQYFYPFNSKDCEKESNRDEATTKVLSTATVLQP